MKYKFWVVSARHPRVEEVVELPDYEWNSEEEKESFVKEQLEMWCEEHYCNWHFSEALISYGHISLDENMQVKEQK